MHYHRANRYVLSKRSETVGTDGRETVWPANEKARRPVSDDPVRYRNYGHASCCTSRAGRRVPCTPSYNVPTQLRKCLSIDRSRSLQPARLRRRQSCTRFMDGRSAEGKREETGRVELGLFDSRRRGLTYRTRSVATTAVAIDRNRDG